MSISRTTMRDLRSRLRADPKSHLEQRAISFGNGPMMEVRHYRAVDLTGVARYLKGVRCYVAEPVVVGRGAGAVATIMSSLPDSNAAEEEALIFVAGLAWHGQIERADKPAKARAARRKNGSSATVPTHRVAMRAGEKVLERKRFACDCLAGS